MSEYDRRVDAFGRKWLSEHPQRLEGVRDRSRPITLYQQFQEGHTYSTLSADCAEFEIGLDVPLVDERTERVWIQYGSDDIDFAGLLQAILEVDLDAE